ncbi:hypothetical protein DUI87_18932 [Hirundo rustica rustica]|uniref:Uncharacterized protein n=1 Tax=Hirundo rustica rustica TaxID=333673 RepID=A0A3M0KBD1_HIRRU|nr:hypothetical protein DUI87_18932 [Hirundo rustica rustica]
MIKIPSLDNWIKADSLYQVAIGEDTEETQSGLIVRAQTPIGEENTLPACSEALTTFRSPEDGQRDCSHAPSIPEWAFLYKEKGFTLPLGIFG